MLVRPVTLGAFLLLFWCVPALPTPRTQQVVLELTGMR